ncbi:MAG: BrnA antitoxin family protein [Roseovarius sp.]
MPAKPTRPRQPRPTQTQLTARERLMQDMIYLQQQSWIPATVAEEIPEAWHTLEVDVPVTEKKEKVTLYLDASVAKFYRAMGQGWHARVNRLLGTYAHMKLAGEVQVVEMLRKRVEERG